MEKKIKKFGTMAGVFTPTFLTILGVIMFIRHPWVVGNSGVMGSILIVLVSVAITLSTALSLSSITTNVRIGSGGAFSLISQSLGLEIGGAIGIPFYFSQAIAVAMYIFGFREGLQSILPEFSPLILDIGVFVLVLTIAFISTSFAFKIQYVIMAIIILSLASIIGGLFVNELNYDIQWFGNYPGSPEDDFNGTSFWLVFAVFFPAVTGVMAGANMSGDLKNPRKNIPNGTLSAVIITAFVYIGLSFVAGFLATPSELVGNYNVFIEKAFFSPIVLAGLLGATLSSALGSFVGAPRILLALGEKRILPKSRFLAKTNKKGEPFNAMLVTSVVVILGLSFRSLNTVAPLITMFFMITYAMVNVVALIEQSLALPSFRPTLKIPLIVPILGTFGSLTVMFIINAAVALTSLVLIVFFYFYLAKKRLKSEVGDSRSGLFTALAGWSTKKTNELSPTREVRSW
ncbi:MAG: amino acid permease, partial [Maribacter sp.]